MRISYDEKFDVLEVFVQEPEPSLTIEVAEDLYYHVVPESKEIIGFTIHRFRARNAPCLLPIESSLRPASPQARELVEKALITA
jgi:uncharacterized protein YuzE